MPTNIRKFKSKIKKNPNSIRVLTEGDSWFHLPIGKNIIDYIEDLTDYNLLREENSGDEMVQIMSGKQKNKIRKYLKNYQFDFLLFSAGGNDLIGSDLDQLLRTPNGLDDDFFLIKERVENKIKLIECLFKELISIRDDYSKNTTIITDCYDYIVPSGVPTRLFGIIPISGPWVKPMLEAHGCYEKSRQSSIIKTLIDDFSQTLQKLEKDHKNFLFLDTRGVVKKNEWQDEIHPNSIANKRIAEMFIDKMKNFR